MLLVHLESPSPRVRYVVHHVLERMLGLAVKYANSVEEFRNATGPRLSYGKERFEGAVSMPWSGGVETLPTADPQVEVVNGTRSMFLVNGEEDVFAGIFYLLSLVDEQRCTERDDHGRVPSSALFCVRTGLADRPWVDEKVHALGELLEKRWPGLRSPSRYTNIVTVDMDNILRYSGRPVGRAIGASLKDAQRGEWSSVMERWQVRARKIPDPYERSIDVLEAHRTKYDRAILFYLMRGNDTYDHAADANHFATRRSIQRAAREFEVGIHPSYGSSVNNELHEQEHGVLQQITGMPVRISRQHFLRWRLPDTLSALSHRNHAEDHTLGFSDRAGFRAGTCTPFPWYDLERETGTTLMLHPFAVMDSALIEQQRLGADDVERRMNVMSDLVRAVGGQYISVWHDRYLSGHREFASWPAVFTRVMEHAKP